MLRVLSRKESSTAINKYNSNSNNFKYTSMKNNKISRNIKDNRKIPLSKKLPLPLPLPLVSATDSATGNGNSNSGSGNGVSTSADRAVLLLQHMVNAGETPDMQCYELVMSAFESCCMAVRCSSSSSSGGNINGGGVSNGGSVSSMSQQYPERALELAKHMLGTGEL